MLLSSRYNDLPNNDLEEKAKALIIDIVHEIFQVLPFYGLSYKRPITDSPLS